MSNHFRDKSERGFFAPYIPILIIYVMKKVLGIMVLTAMLFACNDDDSVVEETLNLSSVSVELTQDDTYLLNAGNTENVMTWYLDNEVVGEGLTYEYSANAIGDYTVAAVHSANHIKDSIVYAIKVFGKYADGVLVLDSSSEDGNSSELTFINNNDEVSLQVFQGVNDSQTISSGLVSANATQDNAFLVSQSGDNYITKINRQTLELESVTTTHPATHPRPSYMNFYNNEAVVVNGYYNDRTFYLWNEAETQFSTFSFDEIDDAPAIQSSALQVGDDLFLVSGDSVYRYSDGDNTLVSFYNADAYVSGVLTDNNGGFYIVKQKSNDTNAQFLHYNSSFELSETVEVPATYSIIRNGNINEANGHFYWQETSTGELIKYDTETQTYTDLGSGYTMGLQFTTVIKENPFTNEIYVGGYTDFMTSKGMVIKLSATGEVLNTYSEIGYAPVDFIFNTRDLWR